ncbi:phosphonate ABC transporter substrate-binding protein [Pantoea trifolii]|uniref:Phosphonate ABC transporter substrate-binding protein n=1 Tax=Pantoea trifolii TaxID=2968030 RepID=A0ABT1VS37_9GAMM|nr:MULTISPECIES: phosphonate ABC transporter substrate-binding protein [unclassified Pantoea]MCQ8230352.1 phosphonate ABC transporter substrate-binding protein [Pantoea sp. MMK2]MCQ8239195.1 phosphonate ABC transporter substrate-binding protein [Pantoea sp. MMK3]
MSLFIKIVVGIVAFFALLLAALYLEQQQIHRADLKACSTLTPQQVRDAVISDVTRRDSRGFSRFQLKPENVYVGLDDIQIGAGSAFAPFRISAEPDREHFAMMGCSDLDRIEYAKN